MINDEIKVLVNEYLVLKKQIDSLKSEQDSVKTKLLMLMDENDVDAMSFDDADVSMVSRTSTSVDKKKAGLLFGEAFNECLKVSESKFVMVKEKKVDEKDYS